MICNSCGGVLGRDCFNPEECQWITDQMNRQNEIDASEVPNLREQLDIAEHELRVAEQTILSLQLANESLQNEIQNLKP